MRFLKVSIATLVALAIALAAFAVPAAAAAAPAPLPTWKVGQAVGYGTSVNLTNLVQPALTTYAANLTASGATVNALAFTGNLDVWVYDQVTGASTSQYTLSEQSASGLKFRFVANLTVSLPVPGTYPGDNSTGTCLPSLSTPMADRPIAVTVDWSSLENGTAMRLYDVTDLPLAQEVANTTLRAQVSVVGTNVPSVALNTTSCQETISYAAKNLVLTADTQSQIRTTYLPSLDTLDFPLTDGKTWWANATATVGGTVSGTINVVGLSASEEHAFFENLTSTLNGIPGVAVTGLTSFPIDLTKITVQEGLNNVLQGGKIQDVTVPVAENLRATAAIRTLGDNAQHPVYLVAPASYTCPATSTLASPAGVSAIYAPDYPAPNAGMIAGYEATYCFGNMNVTLLALESVPTSEAQNNIQQTVSTYNPFPAATSNALANFFLQSPYLGSILIAVVVVAVVASLLVLRRRRKPSAAPPAEPLPPPPPGGPGTP